MKHILLVTGLVLLSGCAGSTWVKSISKDDIVVGYKGYSTAEDAHEAIVKVVQEHCGSYEWQRNDSQSSQYLSSMPNYSTGQNMIVAGTKNWYEATYSCTPRKPASK